MQIHECGCCVETLYLRCVPPPSAAFYRNVPELGLEVLPGVGFGGNKEGMSQAERTVCSWTDGVRSGYRE